MKYQTVPVPEDLIEAINETDLFTNKMQINHFGSDYFTAQDDHYNNNENDSQTQYNVKDNSRDELDSSQQLDSMDSKIIIQQENQILLTVESSKSMSVSMIKNIGITSASTFIQGWFIRYLLEVINSNVSLQPSLPVSLQDDILHHLYRGISIVMSVGSSLHTSLRSGFLHFYLLPSLRSEFLQSSLHVSLKIKFLQSSLLTTL